MKILPLLPLILLLPNCSSGDPANQRPARMAEYAPPALGGGLTEVVNVSGFDPKERQREGRGYSEHDVSAIRDNGASGLIARAGKGGVADTKCATFLASADRVGLLPGVYYRMTEQANAIAQADQLVDRALNIAHSHPWNAPALLLCGDFNAGSKLPDILNFIDRVYSRTGVVPVAYLENSPQLKIMLGNADANTKAKLRGVPYWLALYSHESGAGPLFPAPGSPQGLLDQYRVWSNWTMWQYGGVDWEGGRSQPKVYSHGGYRFSPYLGNLDRPIERNVFNGSPAALRDFWQRHGLRLK